MSDKILVVEDNIFFIKYLKHQLLQAGFEPYFATTVKETENILTKKDDYLCAVLDYCLPDGEEGQVIDIVLKEKITSIVFTGQFSKEIRYAMMNKGVFDYILKDSPISVPNLISAVKRLKANGNHTVLVVDDSIVARTRLSKLLKKQNLKTIQASDGEEALQILESNPYISLIITDHFMPKKDGITMTREIRAKYSNNHFMIIGISSSTDSSITAQFLKAGANDYINKRCNQEEFYCRISNVLNLKEATDILCKIANQDALTGLWNRRYFFKNCGNNNKKEKFIEMNLAMIDIDFFKKVNDTYGHDGGDAVLISISKLIEKYFPTSLVARIGGEEFCVQQNCNFEYFVTTLEAMRIDIQKMTISHLDHKISITVSIGVVRGVEHIDDLLRMADINLYKAKNNGRNLLIYEENVDFYTENNDVMPHSSIIRVKNR